MSKFNYFYKIVNLLDSRYYYYGVHCTDSLDDSYMGSGSLLKQKIQEVGVHNFRKDILKYFNTSSEAFKYEKKRVNKKLLQDPFCYNISEGGKRLSKPYLICTLEETEELCNSSNLSSNLLSRSQFLMINLKLLTYIESSTATILLTYFISQREYFVNKNFIKDTDPFFLTQEKTSADLGLTIPKIQSATKVLQSHSLVAVKKRGLPARNFFTIDDQKIIELLES